MYFKTQYLSWIFILGACTTSPAAAEESKIATAKEESETLEEIEILQEINITVERQPVSLTPYDNTNLATIAKPTVVFGLTPSILTGGHGKEYVFSNQYSDTVSQLNWQIKNVPIIKADFTWNISPHLTFNINGWTTLSSKKVTMDDYDWRDPQNRKNLTDWSNHPNTKLNTANKLDLNLTYWLLQKPNYEIGLLAGYEHSMFSWTAQGGNYQYSLSTAYGDYIPGTAMMYEGKFPDHEQVIGYKQKFKLSYFGLNARYNHHKYEFTAAAKMSPWVKSSTHDEHYLRGLSFVDKADDSSYYSVNLSAGYYLLPHLKLFTEMTWSEYKLAFAKTTINDLIVGDDSGISSRYYNIGIGAQYVF